MKKIFTLLMIAVSFSAFSQVRISQIYGAGGNAGASFTNDFVELFNAGTAAVDISGYSIQYASATGTTWQVTTITAGTIQAGHYFLVQLATGGAVGSPLPTADATGIFNMSGTSGKVALVNVATALSGATACSDASVVDVVGYGAAGCFEGAVLPTGTIDNTKSMLRKSAGCTETNNNANDFEILATNPRNSSTTANPCGAPAASLSAGPSVTGLTTLSGTASTPGSYTLSGTLLTGAPGNIVLTPSENLEISLSSSTGFTDGTLNVPYTSATLAATTIYVRISDVAPLGAISGTVTNVGGGATATVTVSGNVLPAEPTVQASNITFANVGNNGFDVNFTNGNGNNRIVVVRQTTATEVAPTDGTTYTAPTTTGTGNSVVYSGTGSGPVTVTGLVAGTNYTVRVYEANSTNYLTTTATGNPNSVSTTGISPVLTQVNFTGVAVPQYMASGDAANTRIPVLFVATVSNLTPNTTYRYYTQGAAASDLGTSATGAGNALLFDYTASPVTYTYSSTLSLTSANNYGKFTTNASGSFTGTFAIVPTTNSRFFAINTVIPAIAIGLDVASPAVLNRFALNQTIAPLQFVATTAATDGSFIKGTSSATPGNVVALWKSVDGNIVATRPLAMTLAENPTIAGATWAASFIAGYDQTAGSWNTVIPNANAEGVRLIQQLTLNGAVVGCNSDADGTWPSGVVTADPTSGATALQISTTDAPINAGVCFGVLPVNLTSFTAQKANRTVLLKWTTAQELNSRNFIVERSADNRTWISIATIAAAGSSTTERNYTYTDNTPAKGMNYYRIKQVDLDSRSITSNVRPVLFTESYAITIGPNPTSDFINIYISKNDLKPTQVIVADVNGKIIEKYSTADAMLKISTTRYSKGVYLIKVISDENTTTQKIIVQ